MDLAELQISTFALFSRLFVLLLQCLCNLVIPDHDAGVFYPPSDSDLSKQLTWLDHLIIFFLGGLRRWDAVYFIHIMQYGYTYENCVAFFPLYPMVTSTLASILTKVGLLHHSSWILLTSVTINVFLFVGTAKALYRLGQLVISNSVLAFYAAILFCINPASIFMTAPYSEILYCYLLVHALELLISGRRPAAAVLLGLSSLTRSNGIVGAGFVLHAIAQSFLIQCSQLCRREQFGLLQYLIISSSLVLQVAIKVLGYLLVIIGPFFLYELYIYMKFCVWSDVNESIPAHLLSYGRLQSYHVLGDPPSAWCNHTLPLSYSYIQEHHWGVGFLSYYEIKQLPNFFLSLPVVILSFRSCFYFMNLNPQSFYTLGLGVGGNHSQLEKESEKKDDDRKGEDISHCFTARGPRSGNLVVYVVHLFILTIFGCCFVHIQVLTRLIFSASPVIYWYCASLLGNTSAHFRYLPASHWQSYTTGDIQTFKLVHQCLAWLNLPIINHLVVGWRHLNLTCRLIILYFLVYLLVGTAMFSNFLPWT